MHRFLLCALALCGCVTPSPEFFGAERREVQRGDHRYLLLLHPDRAEVVRLTSARPGSHAAIMADMSALVAETTRCRPVPYGLTADSGVMRFRLTDCAAH